MSVTLHRLRQISLPVDDVDRAEAFYTGILGLRKLHRFGQLLFLDCDGVRLFISPVERLPFTPATTALYFHTNDIALTWKELRAKGVSFIDLPHMIAEMPDHDLWMAFFTDPAGNPLALLHEAPRGWKPNLA